MQECRRLRSSEKPCQLDLAAGRVEQILTANDDRHALQPVIDDDRKLIGPVSMAIASEEVAALFGRSLLLRAEPKVAETFYCGFEPHPHAQSGRLGEMFS